MAREFGRSSRVASQIQKELAVILQREFGGKLGFITINEVTASHDISMAKVYFTILNADDQTKRKSVNFLNESVPFIRSELGKRMRLRNVPVLKFYYDDSFETGMRVAELLSEDSTKDKNSSD